MEARRQGHPDWKGVGIVAGSVVGAAIGCLIIYFTEPGSSPLLPPCPFHWLTGLWCPGCGSGRALHALLHGKIMRALDFNPLMIVSLPFLGYAAASWLLFSVRGKPLPRIVTGRSWGWFVVCLVFAYWVLRNIPVYPFSVLAP